MRIDLSNSAASQISSETKSQHVGAGTVSNPSGAGGDDRATLSSDSTSVSSLVSTAMSLPDIRQDKVASLRQAVTSGTYQLDPKKIAASMLDEQA
jgi:flagellar biosynthesis anti-sigma factor FlgM